MAERLIDHAMSLQAIESVELFGHDANFEVTSAVGRSGVPYAYDYRR